MSLDNFAARERVAKTIRLERQTIDGVQQTAKNLNKNFSRTAEHLLRIGLQHSHDPGSNLNMENERRASRQGMGEALSGYLKLLSQAVLTANEAKEMAQQVFFVQLRQLANELSHPDQIYNALALFPEEDALHKALYQVYQQRQARGQQRAIEQLKSTTAIDETLWQEIVRWVGKDEQVAEPLSHPLREAVEETVHQQMDRYLKLLVKAVLAADEAKEMAQQIFFMQLRQLADEIQRPSEIRASLALNGNDPLQSALYEAYMQRKKRGRNRAVRQLKSVIDVDSAAWQQVIEQMGGYQ